MIPLSAYSKTTYQLPRRQLLQTKYEYDTYKWFKNVPNLSKLTTDFVIKRF